MDFDSIVSLLLIIAFFILPSILKQINTKKKRPGASSVPRKNLSIFEKIKGQIHQFIQELEQQAQQQKQAASNSSREDKDPAGIWELLGEDQEDSQGADPVETVAPDNMLTRQKEEQPEVEKESGKKRKEKKGTQRETRPVEPSFIPTVSSKKLAFKSDPLQNAIVLSEILSKPIALRKK